MRVTHKQDGSMRQARGGERGRESGDDEVASGEKEGTVKQDGVEGCGGPVGRLRGGLRLVVDGRVGCMGLENGQPSRAAAQDCTL